MRLARPVLLLALAASLTACGGGGEQAGGCAQPHASGAAVEAGHVVRTVPTRDPRELATLSPDQAALVEQLAAAEAAHAASSGAEVSGGSEHRALASGGGDEEEKHDEPAASCAPTTTAEKTETAGH